MNITLIFASIFLAELPDKTSLATISLATKHNFWRIWLGASLALASQTLLAILAGRLLANLPKAPLHLLEAILFMGFALWMWKESQEPEPLPPVANAPIGRFVVGRAFIVVFMAEFLDLTQFATITWASRFPDSLWTIGTVAVLALVLANGVSALVGRGISRWVPAQRLSQVASLLFLTIGVWTLLTTLGSL